MEQVKTKRPGRPRGSKNAKVTYTLEVVKDKKKTRVTTDSKQTLLSVLGGF